MIAQDLKDLAAIVVLQDDLLSGMLTLTIQLAEKDSSSEVIHHIEQLQAVEQRRKAMVIRLKTQLGMK